LEKVLWSLKEMEHEVKLFSKIILRTGESITWDIDFEN